MVNTGNYTRTIVFDYFFHEDRKKSTERNAVLGFIFKNKNGRKTVLFILQIMIWVKILNLNNSKTRLFLLINPIKI
jgi:hypothetical protein